MKSIRKRLLPSLLLMICLFLTIMIPVTQATADSKDTPYIIDIANILTNDEELNDLANKYSQKHDTSIVIVTTDNTSDLSTENYASMYYHTYIHGQDGYNDDCVLFLIDMDHSETNIYAYEDAAIRMATERCDKILDVVTPKLSKEDYDKAAKTFIKKTNTYLGTDPDVNPDNIFYKLWFQVLISVIIGATTVGIMIFNSGGRVTTNSSTYLDHNNSRLTGSFDHYIRTTTRRVKKPENNNNGGGSHGGTTGGGSSFSSGSQRGF
ncbi:TPM domain-containing protein [Anaerosporobacter sp.]